MISIGRLPAWTPARPRALHLGQAPAGVAVQVAVVDVNGRPISGALVSARLLGTTIGPMSGETDGNGLATLFFRGPLAGAQRVEIEAKLGVYRAFQTVDDGSRGTIFIQIPVCLSQPILTTPEAIALVTAVALTGAGFYWKVDTLKITGEIFFGAVVFTSLFRLSCL